MPKQPNMNAMMQQVQQMQAEMAKAQEELKNEIVEASAGGGMVTVKMTGDLELQGARDRPRRGGPRGRRAAPGHGAGGGQRGGARRRRSWPRTKMGAATGGLGGRAASAASACPGL